MQYEAELKFLKKLLMQFYLNMHLITKDNPLDENVDNGLRKFLGVENDYDKCFRSFLQRAQSNIVYKISDDFFCSYIVMMLPSEKQEEKSFLIIGPHTEQDFSKRDIFMAIEKYQLPPRLTERLIQYFGSVPLVSDSTALSAICSTLAETIWKSADNYTVKHISHSLSEEYIGAIPANMNDPIPEQRMFLLKCSFWKHDMPVKISSSNTSLRETIIKPKLPLTAAHFLILKSASVILLEILKTIAFP